MICFQRPWTSLAIGRCGVFCNASEVTEIGHTGNNGQSKQEVLPALLAQAT